MKQCTRISLFSILSLVLSLILSLVLLGCSSVPQESVPQEKQCATDRDCVAATCCHAAEAVNQQYASDCTEQFCTAECQPQTLDCDQGEIKCQENVCTVLFNEP